MLSSREASLSYIMMVHCNSMRWNLREVSIEDMNPLILMYWVHIHVNDTPVVQVAPLRNTVDTLSMVNIGNQHHCVTFPNPGINVYEYHNTSYL